MEFKDERQRKKDEEQMQVHDMLAGLQWRKNVLTMERQNMPG
jgi:hypothetical protein